MSLRQTEGLIVLQALLLLVGVCMVLA